jgi:hypothetical protein
LPHGTSRSIEIRDPKVRQQGESARGFVLQHRCSQSRIRQPNRA